MTENKTIEVKIQIPQNVFDFLKDYCQFFHKDIDEELRDSIVSGVSGLANEFTPEMAKRLKDHYKINDC